MKTKRSKTTDIPQKVKKIVWERDGGCCVVCGMNGYVMPNAHFLPRGSKGGLGIEQNIVTLCSNCHHMTDNSPRRYEYLKIIRDYLIKCYPEWEDSYIYGYKAMETHSNYWLKKMKNKIYYEKEK